MKVSVVCCYNNKKMFEEVLVKSLKKQVDCEYELISVDNSDNKFNNCATALNWAIEKTTSSYIICIHQDFEFSNETVLKHIGNVFKKIGDYDVFGAAGAIYDANAGFLKSIALRKRKCIDSLGEKRIEVEKLINGLAKVETLDECCFCFKKALWEKHHFSEKLCPYWDLYGVEMCLYAQYFLHGSIFVIPMKAIHHSGGHLTKKFYLSLYNIMKYYNGKAQRIVTTCVSTKNSFPLIKYYWLCVINTMRNIIAHKTSFSR